MALMDIGLLFVAFNFIGAVYGADVYVGKEIGELNSYHHQVGGKVYAVNKNTFLIKNFMYDGNGQDTFFWAGSKPRPGSQGFIVPNEFGRTNVLDRYLNKDITITLPERTIVEIKWLAIYDLTRLESFGEIYIPEYFEPPQEIILNKLSSRSGEVQSGAVIIKESKTIVIQDLVYDGTGEEVYFWVGVGPQPHSKGSKIPDEHGFMTPLKKYNKKTITLELPGDMTVFTVDWLSIYDIKNQKVLGSIIIPEDLNVPPSLVKVIPHENDMPNCEQLHKNLQISWDVFGSQVTLELAAQVDEMDYIAFGMSGSPTEPKMIDGDVVIAFMDGHLQHLVDYNISSYMPCTKLLGQHKGVCEDDKVGGHQNYQAHSSKREDGINVFTFRRPLTTPDDGDTPYPAEGEAMIIWALGRLDINQRPTMHYAWSKVKQPIEFAKVAGEKNCFAFTRSTKPKLKPWGPFHIADPALREFTARLGPDGGPRGYSGMTKQESETGLAWYINGYMTPSVYLKRDTRYRFLVEGGSNPYDPKSYHPMMITDEPHGGYSQLTEEQQKDVRVLAGIGYSVRGDPRPTTAGRLCLWKHPPEIDRRKDVEFMTFERYRNSLTLNCDDEGKAAVLEFTPNKSWPDIVYYNSWTGKNMGWRLYILDEINTEKILREAASNSMLVSVPAIHVYILIALGLWSYLMVLV
ncbi:protein Skeletor, isoforms B/C-like [Macrobrachium nipponense]|uniref:protein Skeletor, isoforms B/C-like n=1 Tax=Macrobrachium nipponense TaxID=159736 RepID=UPI0030C7C7C9